jgi:hypothetical protein
MAVFAVGGVEAAAGAAAVAAAVDGVIGGAVGGVVVAASAAVEAGERPDRLGWLRLTADRVRLAAPVAARDAPVGLHRPVPADGERDQAG